MSESKYTHANYGLGFTTKKAEPLEIRPSWFARVILRQKPKILNVNASASALAARKRAGEEEFARSIFKV